MSSRQQRKFPRSVVVHGVTYRVAMAKSPLKYSGSEVYGYCDLSNHIIYIDRTLSESKKWSTLIHELGHAAYEETGFGYLMALQVENPSVREYVEEDMMRRLLPAFLAAVDTVRH